MSADAIHHYSRTAKYAGFFQASSEDLGRMREKLFFDGESATQKLLNFWILLCLAAVIASAGIVADSTATVIGAMIVAPLMTPILGTALAVVSKDGENLARSLALVAAGAAAVVAIGFFLGALEPLGTTSETSSQVETRIHPRLVDLLAALATGAVGAFALSRPDVSDTLPGVAIAISLVPPLAVVGLTLQAGALNESLGAMLLFLTNVGAILLTGILVMAVFHVHHLVRGVDAPSSTRQVAVIVAFVILLAVPLSVSSTRSAHERAEVGKVHEIATQWAVASSWQVIGVSGTPDGVEVRAIGAPPAPDPQALRTALDAAGLTSTEVELELVPTQIVRLPGR